MLIENGILENSGDILLIDFEKPFKCVKTFNSFTDRKSIETLEKYFVTEFRYSPDNENFSLWQELTNINLQNITITDEIYLEIKYTREGDDENGTLVVLELNFDITYKETQESKQQQKCNTKCNTSCNEISTGGEQAFNKYEIGKINCLQNIINNAIVKTDGHCVEYFRAVGDEYSSDVIFKEYSLYNVSDPKNIKIIIPNNELPDNQVNFTVSDMDFYNLPFEIHIGLVEWQNVFGYTAPSKNDILYIEVLDRIYQVESAYLFKPMGTQTGTYYKVNLEKWQDSVNNAMSDAARDRLDELSISVEELMGEEKEDEILQVAKPQDYDVKSTTFDVVRKTVNIPIYSHILDNNWTVISQNYYNLSDVTFNSDAVVYNNTPTITNNVAISLWVNLNASINLAQDNFLLRSDDNNVSGINVYYNNSGLNIWINGNVHTFNVGFNLGEWYGVFINISTQFNQISVSTYQIPPYNNLVNTENEPVTLTARFVDTNSVNITNLKMLPETKLVGSDLLITNIRVFDQLVGTQSNQINILNQYVVEDNQHAPLIDNAKDQQTIIHRHPHK